MTPRRLLAGLGLALLGALLAVTLIPIRPPAVRSRPRPALSYEEAARRVAALQASKGPEVHGACGTVLLAHGRKTPRVFVFFHGLASCPMQFRALGERLHARGYNVYLPRGPRHGLADRMTDVLRGLTAEELARAADEQVDIARGLGDTVVVAGLSIGAIQAAWLAQERPDVERAVLIAPSFGLALVPGPLLGPLVRFWLRTPNRFLWWDPRVREALPGPGYTYPRYSTRALAQALRLARAVAVRARREPPAARSVALVTTEADRAVDNHAAAAVLRDWERHGRTRLTAYRFSRDQRVGHDLVNPEQPYQRVGIVLPVLEKLLLE